MSERELWVWIRVPLSALERAVSALKASVSYLNLWGLRDEAHSNDAAAEDIKKSLRESHDDSDHT